MKVKIFVYVFLKIWIFGFIIYINLVVIGIRYFIYIYIINSLLLIVKLIKLFFIDIGCINIKIIYICDVFIYEYIIKCLN